MIRAEATRPEATPPGTSVPLGTSPQSWLTADECGPLLAVPADQLYWAAIEAPPGRASADALRFAFEASIPETIDDVETRFVNRDDGRIIACGVNRSRLRDWIESLDSEAPDRIQPASGPAHLDAPAINVERLEFRTGDFEPPSRRRRRRVHTSVRAASLVMAAGLVALGLQLRTQRAHDDMDRLHSASYSAIHEVLPTASESTVDPQLQLLAALRTARQTRGGDDAIETPGDQSPLLLRLLQIWPEEIAIRIDRMQIDDDLITLAGAVTEPAAYQDLLLALGDYGDDWSAPTGSTSRTRDEYAFTIVLKRLPKESAA